MILTVISMFNSFFVFLVSVAATDELGYATAKLIYNEHKPVDYKLSNHSMYVDLSNISAVMKLYSRRNPNESQLITIENMNKISKEFPSNEQYKFLFHGWQDNVTSSWYAGVVDAYMMKGNVSVITVEYPDISTLFKNSTGEFLKQNGKNVAKIIKNLHENHHVPLKNIHLIAHSVGVHAASATATIFEMMTGHKIERITGLDPTEPHHIPGSYWYEFGKNSAKFIDNIHTSFLGKVWPEGTIDFYVNGLNHTGCNESVHCEHMLSTRLFELSIKDNKFMARRCINYLEFKHGKCDDYLKAEMGENVQRKNRNGQFYIDIDKLVYGDLAKDVEVAGFDRSIYKFYVV